MIQTRREKIETSARILGFGSISTRGPEPAGCCQLSSHSVHDRWHLDLSPFLFLFSQFITSHSLPLHVVTTVTYWGLCHMESYNYFLFIIITNIVVFTT